MPDLKISQLPAASTPLAGTELVPIVQGGTTDQTTVQAILTSAVPSGTANGVLYLNGSKVVTSGSGLTFDGTNLGVGTSLAGAGKIDAISNGTSVLNARATSSGAGQSVTVIRATDSGNAAYANALYVGVEHAWFNGGAEQMRLTSTGLGIGTSSPGAKLDVNGQIFGRSSFSTYTPDGLFSTDARPSKIITPGAGEPNVLFGYSDDGSGQYNPRIGFKNGSAATAAANSIGNDSSGNLVFGTGSTSATSRVWLDQSGNLGLGVTPTGTSKFETYTGAGAFNAITARFNASNVPIAFGVTNANGFPYLGFNTVQANGTDNQTYSINNFASRLDAANGGFRFWVAPSGTAGNAISFTQAMTLDASGNLLVGGTAALYGAAGRGLVQVSGSSQALLGFGTTGNVGLGFLYHTGTNFEITNSQNGYLSFGTNNTERARIPAAGGMVVGTAALATSATDGFLYVPTCAGTPTGTPTTQTGTAPIVVDTTNNKLYFYSGGQWRDAGP